MGTCHIILFQLSHWMLWNPENPIILKFISNENRTICHSTLFKVKGRKSPDQSNKGSLTWHEYICINSYTSLWMGHESELSGISSRKSEVIYSFPAHGKIIYLDWKCTAALGNKLFYASLIAGIGFHILLWHEAMDNYRPGQRDCQICRQACGATDFKSEPDKLQ